MKAITIQQPLAAMIGLGVKKIEYRTWETSYRGKLAIHASAKMTKEHAEFCKKKSIITMLQPVVNRYGDLPLGKIIAVVDLVDIFPFTWHNLPKYLAIEKRFKFPCENEYCWVLEKPRFLDEPIPWKGQLGLWEIPREI